jgi:hypothetical protein
MLLPEPEQRPSCEQLLKHPLLRTKKEQIIEQEKEKVQELKLALERELMKNAKLEAELEFYR